MRDFIPRRMESIAAQLSGKSKGFVPQNRMRFGGGPGGPGGPGGFGPPGANNLRPGTIEAQELLKAMDTERNKSLSVTELNAGASQFFKTADKDKNGSLNNEEITNELDNLFSSVGLMAPSFIAARSILKLADTNRDEQLNQAEWNSAIAKQFSEWDSNKNQTLEEPEMAEGIGKILMAGFPRFEPVTPPTNGEKPPIKN